MKKFLCVTLAVLMTLTLVPGCQKNGAGDGEKTEILLGLPGGDSGTNWKIVENFKAAYADKYIVTEDTAGWSDFAKKIKLQMVSKKDVMPVFVTDSMQAMTFGAQGVVLDLKDWIDKEIDAELYNNALFALQDDDGHVWGVPRELNSIAIYYNKDIFDERNVPYPTEDWTWDDLLRLAKELTFDRDGDGKTDVYGIEYITNITQGWLPFMAAVGVSPYKNNYRDSNLDDPLIKTAMEYYGQPFREGCLCNQADLAALGGSTQAFAGGRIAMYLSQSSSIETINHIAPDLNWDVQIMPIGWNGERTVIYVPNAFQIYSGVEENVKEGALDWLKYYLSEEAQMLLAMEGPSGFPIMRSALDAISSAGRTPANISAFYREIDNCGMTILENPAAAVINPKINGLAAMVKKGEVSIDEAIAESHKAMQEELDIFYDNM